MSSFRTLRNPVVLQQSALVPRAYRLIADASRFLSWRTLSHRSGGSRLRSFIVGCALLVPVATAYAQRPTDTTLHLSDGRVQEITLISANETGIIWTERNDSTTQLTPHNRIARVDFPVPEIWKVAEEAFYKGDFATAIAAFSVLAKNPDINFYPTPGNFTSLGRLRLIECFRETGNANAIAETAATIDGKALPMAKRNRMAVIEVWAELTTGDWGEVLTKAEAVSSNPIANGRNELGFIKALALEKTGKHKEAIIAYGTAYTVNFGASRELAKRAMKNTILLLVELDHEERESELHALVHTYAKVHNRGKLWEGAPPRVVELLKTKLDMPPKLATEEKPKKGEPEEPKESSPESPGKGGSAKSKKK